jgi:hypothetical protein
LKPLGVEFVGIAENPGERRSKVSALVRKHGLPWPQLVLGDDATVERFDKQFAIVGNPVGFLVDKQGHLVRSAGLFAWDDGERYLYAEIERALKGKGGLAHAR